MKRLVIAVDCDDVLIPTTPWFVAQYNKQYGTSVTLADAHIESDAIWGVSHDEMLRRLAQMMNTDDYRLLGPSLEEVEVLRYLAEHHELHLVTARKEVERAATQAVLDRDLAGVFTSMEFVGWQGSKGDICQRIGADVLIDDNARHLHNALEHGLSVGGAILFGEYPWNAESRDDGELKYCSTWNDVKTIVDKLAAQG